MSTRWSPQRANQAIHASIPAFISAGSAFFAISTKDVGMW